MTIAANEPLRAGPYEGNGVTTEFDYAFTVFNDADLLVQRRNADDTVDDLTLTTDYTVTGATDGSPTRRITLTSGALLPTGASLTIVPDAALEQPEPFSSQGSLDLSVLERALDRITVLVRGTAERNERALALPPEVAGLIWNALAGGRVLMLDDAAERVITGPSPAEISGAAAAASDAVEARAGAEAARATAEAAVDRMFDHNLLVNGNMMVWQRGEGSRSGAGWHADRWRASGTASNIASIRNGPLGGMRVTADGDGSLSIDQGVEFDQAMLGATFTLTFDATIVGAAVAVDIWAQNGGLVAPDTGDSSKIVDNAAPADLGASVGAFRRYRHTFTVPSSFMFTPTTLRVSIRGATPSITSLELARAQLEGGPVATPYSFRPAQTELAMCQRWYEKDVRATINLDATSGSTYRTQSEWKVTKAATPTVTTAVLTNVNFNGGSLATSATVSGVETRASATATAAGLLQIGLTADAEF